jgi:hypothetical protein
MSQSLPLCVLVDSKRLKVFSPFLGDIAMEHLPQITCRHCLAPFTPRDFGERESEEMETEREESGLQGFRFRYFQCSHCSSKSVFLEIRRLPEESSDEFLARKNDLAEVVEHARIDDMEVKIVEASTQPMP